MIEADGGPCYFTVLFLNGTNHFKYFVFLEWEWIHYVLIVTLGNSFFIFEGEEKCWAYDLDSQISFGDFAV